MGEFVMNIIGWQLDDPTQTALSSTALLRTAPVLSDWESPFGLIIRFRMVASVLFSSRSGCGCEALPQRRR
jgi:hypothetical protein